MEGFEKLLQKTNMKTAQSLNNQGKIFTSDLYKWNRPLLDKYTKKGFDYLTVICGLDLTWSGHAKYNDLEKFLDEMLPWLESGDPVDKEFVGHWHTYLGSDALVNAMKSIRTLNKAIKPIAPDFNSCNTKDMLKFQNNSLRTAEKLYDKQEIHGLGAWIFLGIFKLILSVEKRLWDAPNIDSVILPSGRSVVNGIRRLLKEAPSFSKFDLNWLSDSEPSIKRCMGPEYLIHNECCRIANMIGSTGMHINSALYQYGRKDINI